MIAMICTYTFHFNDQDDKSKSPINHIWMTEVKDTDAIWFADAIRHAETSLSKEEQ